MSETTETRYGHRAVVISVTPRAKQAAGIEVGVVEELGAVDVVLGEAAVFELEADAEVKYRDTLDELRQLCEAAVAGRIRETVWKRNGETVRSFATLETDRGTMETTRRNAFLLPFAKTSKLERRYSAYAGVVAGRSGETTTS